jgi:hypothetical protein
MNALTTTRQIATVQEVPEKRLPAVRSEAPPTVPAQAPTPLVYPRAIAGALMAVRREISPIAKEGENTFHKYRYVKSEDVIDEVMPLLTRHGLMITQSELSRTMLDRTLAVTYEYIITNAEGDVWPDRVTRTGLANVQDSKGINDDKAANKASTQSEKYFYIKFFGIRTSDAAQNDNDAGPPKPDAPPPVVREPAGEPPVPPVDDEPPVPPAEDEPPIEEPTDELGIPEFLRRTEEPDPTDFDEDQWLRDLEGACSGATDLEQLQKVQAKVQLPARELVSVAAWEAGKAILVERAAELDHEEAPDD